MCCYVTWPGGGLSNGDCFCRGSCIFRAARARSRKSAGFCVAFSAEFREAFCRTAASQYAVRSLHVVAVVQSDECLITVEASLNATCF